MLAPQAVDIHSLNLSSYYFTMFHICRTIRRHFSLVEHWSAEIQTKVYDTRSDRSTKRVNPRSLT